MLIYICYSSGTVPTIDSCDLNLVAVIRNNLADMETEVNNVCVDRDTHGPASLEEDGNIACDDTVIMSQREEFLSLYNECDVDSKTATSKHRQEIEHVKQHDERSDPNVRNVNTKFVNIHMLPKCHTEPISPTVCLMDVGQEKYHIKEHDKEVNLEPSRKYIQTNSENNIATITGEKSHSCPQCNKSFRRAFNLKQHIMIHTGEKPYSCPQCNKSFISNNHLKQHVMTHIEGERPHSCPQCNKRFIRPYDLKQHIMNHTGEKPYSCPQCNKSFISNNHLKQHVMTHIEGERPHSCPQCNKSFRRAFNLKQHIMIHTGEKPYSCPQCNKSFISNNHLKRHITTHIGEKQHLCPR